MSFSGEPEKPDTLNIRITATDLLAKNTFDDFQLKIIKNPENMIIYPNPSEGTFYIRVDSDIKTYDIQVISITGKVLYSKSYENNKTQTLKLNKLSSGIYFIKLTAQNKQSFMEKIIIK